MRVRERERERKRERERENQRESINNKINCMIGELKNRLFGKTTTTNGINRLFQELQQQNKHYFYMPSRLIYHYTNTRFHDFIRRRI